MREGTMDTGNEELAPLSEERAKELEKKGVNGIFSIGETVELKGSYFKIGYISRTKISMEILARGR
jgi:hypothetical protein